MSVRPEGPGVLLDYLDRSCTRARTSCSRPSRPTISTGSSTVAGTHPSPWASASSASPTTAYSIVGQAAYVRGLLRAYRATRPTSEPGAAGQRTYSEYGRSWCSRGCGRRARPSVRPAASTTTRRARTPGSWPRGDQCAQPARPGGGHGAHPLQARHAVALERHGGRHSGPCPPGNDHVGRRVLDDRRRPSNSSREHFGGHAVGRVRLGVHVDEVPHAAFVIDPAPARPRRLPGGRGAARPRASRGTGSPKVSSPAAVHAARRSSSCPVSRTLTENPLAGPAEERLGVGDQVGSLDAVVAAQRFVGHDGEPGAARTEHAPSRSSSAPLVLHRVIARLNAIRLAWPSSASADGGHHRCMMPRSAGSAQGEDRVTRRLGLPFGVARVRLHAVEEHAVLELPALQVGAQDGQALIGRDLGRRHSWRRRPRISTRCPSSAADVADPLGLAPGGDEVLLCPRR